MARLDSLLNIDTAKLRRWGYLKQGTGGNSGRILWNDGGSVVECGTELFGEMGWLQLRYTVSTYEEKKAMDYRVPLVPTPCRFGSLRWWFSCHHCGRRCRILYFVSPLFVCRTCTGAWYRSQEYRGGFYGLLRRLFDADDFEETMKRWGIENIFRSAKVCFGLEKVRVQSFRKIHLHARCCHSPRPQTLHHEERSLTLNYDSFVRFLRQSLPPLIHRERSPPIQLRLFSPVTLLKIA